MKTITIIVGLFFSSIFSGQKENVYKIPESMLVDLNCAAYDTGYKKALSTVASVSVISKKEMNVILKFYKADSMKFRSNTKELLNDNN